MIRVAVVMGKMHSGGKKNLVMEYYRHIDRSKVQFDFICDSDSNAIPEEEINALGGRVYRISPYQNILANMKDIRKLCRKNNYQILHGYNGTMNVFAMIAAKQCGVPVRINESISMAHSADKKTILKKILKPFSRLCSTHFMANGEECGRWQFGDKFFEEGKVTVFKTVIDTEKNRFQPELREKTRYEYNLTDNIVFGHIGRLTAQKNTLFIIDVFNEIAKKEPRAKLIIIGDGELREPMISRINDYGISEKVIYLGRREDIQQFYNAMDCFLLPSLYEGLPVVGIEAECCGLPMVFSTEIPRESSPCDDLGLFLPLSEPADVWADHIIDWINTIERKDYSQQVLQAGFDSACQASKLALYYESQTHLREQLRVNNS